MHSSIRKITPLSYSVLREFRMRLSPIRLSLRKQLAALVEASKEASKRVPRIRTLMMGLVGQMAPVVQPANTEGSIDLKGPVLFSGREEREGERG